MNMNEAQSTKQGEGEGLGTMFLTFILGDESYGLPIQSVTEIIGLQEITTIPDVPNHIRGIINLRGKVIPVMDVRLRFGMQERAYDARTCIIVVQVDETSVGLVVDTVSEVTTIPLDQITCTPSMGSSKSNDAVECVGKIGDEIKLLLNVERLLYVDSTNQLAA